MVNALFVLTIAAPAGMVAEGAPRGGPKRPIRPPGTTPFKFSHASYRPRVSVKNIRQEGGLVLVDISFYVPRGHVEKVDVLLDGLRVASIPIPGSNKRGSLTAKLAASKIGRGGHSVVVHAHQGRPGHQSIKGISKTASFTR